MIGNEGIQYCLQPACFLNCWKSPVMRVGAALWNATARSWRRLSWVMLWQVMMWIHGRHINRWWRPGREKRRTDHKAEVKNQAIKPCPRRLFSAFVNQPPTSTYGEANCNTSRSKSKYCAIVA